MAIKVNNYTIYTPVDEILAILKIELSEQGIYLFDVVKQTGNNFMTRCPFHKEGKESKPSFGISTDGQCHCFACGWSTSDFSEFISALFGFDENSDYGQRWLLQHLSNVYSERKPLELNLTRGIPQKQSKIIISEEELDSYRYTHPYMYQRHLTDELIERFDIGYDPNRLCLTFPVKDLDGDVVSVVTRSVVSKFFTLPSGEQKPIYGAYLFTSGKYTEAVICESVLNALTCWKFDKPAVALFGTGSYYQIDILRRLPIRHYILGLDPDDAGEKGIQRIKAGLRGTKLLSKYIIPKGMDLNDLDDKILTLPKIPI